MTDITYIPMARGFAYLIAIVDWLSRRVLSWQLSITPQTDFCIEALEEAMTCFGGPDIFNSDQGSQFTSIAFTAFLHRGKIAISMDLPRSLTGQCFHRAPVALVQIREGLSPSLRLGQRSARTAWPISDFLQ